MTEITVENGNPNYMSDNGVLFNIDKTTLIQCPGGKKGGYDIPNSVTTIGKSAFEDCISLTSVSIPNSVTTIGESAFEFCRRLTSVSIPNSVTTIAEDAFYYCGLTSVTIPNSVTTLGKSAFGGCENLTYVSIPNSVTTIADFAFSHCTGLTSVTIPDSIEEIKDGVFMGCNNLATVTIPASVTKIGASAFQECESLKTIYDLNPTPQTLGRDAFRMVPQDAVVYIPSGCFNKYFVAEGWIHFTDFREMEAGVQDVFTDSDASVDVFSHQGVAVLRNASAAELENLPAGIYIVRQGKEVKKIAVK